MIKQLFAQIIDHTQRDFGHKIIATEEPQAPYNTNRYHAQRNKYHEVGIFILQSIDKILHHMSKCALRASISGKTQHADQKIQPVPTTIGQQATVY